MFNSPAELRLLETDQKKVCAKGGGENEVRCRVRLFCVKLVVFQTGIKFNPDVFKLT